MGHDGIDWVVAVTDWYVRRALRYTPMEQVLIRMVTVTVLVRYLVLDLIAVLLVSLFRVYYMASVYYWSCSLTCEESRQRILELIVQTKLRRRCTMTSTVPTARTGLPYRVRDGATAFVVFCDGLRQGKWCVCTRRWTILASIRPKRT